MELKEAQMCKTCAGAGGGNADYLNTDGHLERGTGDWENCFDCGGDGLEHDEEIVKERIVENLNEDQEGKLKLYFIKNDGWNSNKDNYEELFDRWLGEVSLETLIKTIYG